MTKTRKIGKFGLYSLTAGRWQKVKGFCGLCGEMYQYSVKEVKGEGGNYCLHDCNLGNHWDTYEYNHILPNLPPNKVAVKGSDGLTRICEKV